MSFLGAVPDAVAQAASTLESIGSRLSAASSAAAAPTTGIAAAAQDEISTAVAGLFGNFGAEFQGLSAEAQAFHDGFVDTLTGSMSQYLSAEAAAQQLLADPVTGIESALDNAVVASPLGQLVSAATGIVDMPFSVTALDYGTPLGSLVVTLYGNAPMLGLGQASVTGGSLAVSPPLALALDALGPEFNASVAFGNTSAAFAHAIQTGNPMSAAETVLEAPGNVLNGFVYGVGTMSGVVSLPSNTGYSSVSYHIPFGGLLAPARPVVLTLVASDGTPTTFALSGTEFGGLIAAIEALF